MIKAGPQGVGLPSEQMLPGETTPDQHVIPVFGFLEPSLDRGGQPSREGYTWLAERGFRIIVNLRHRDESSMVDRVPGLRPVRIPVLNDYPPSEEQCFQWLDLCAYNLPARPIFFHCKGGNGRTSTFAIVYRIAQGSDADAAFEEELPYGFDPGGEHQKQARFLRGFYGRVRSGELALPVVP